MPALWLGCSVVYAHLPRLAFTTLLPRATYPVAICLAVFIAMGSMWGMEGNLATLGWAGSMRLAFRQWMVITGAVFTVVVGLKDPGISRVFLACYLVIAGGVLVFLNRVQPSLLVRFLFRGGYELPTLVIGDVALFPEFNEWLDLRRQFGLNPIGGVRYGGRSPAISDLDVVGDFADLKGVISRTGARQVLMLSLPQSAEDAEHLARVCAACGCRLLIHNNLTYRLTYPLRVLSQDGYSFLAFQDEPLEDPLNRATKRALDIALAVPIVVLVLPLLTALVWLIQRRQSPGPVFYLQRRCGRGGRIFRIVKFRTMRVDANDGSSQTSANDDRVYGFGRFLRRSSLDELPQFLNVLRGDMSVVGPRPHFVWHDDLFADAVNEYRIRYFVKPGITGLAQSRGFRGEVRSTDSINQRIQLDLMYIHSWSVWLDFAIIARTVCQLFFPPPTAR